MTDLPRDQKRSKTLDMVGFVVPSLLCVALLAYVSPQVSQKGRGLNTALPAYSMAVAILAVMRPICLLRAFRRFWPSILLGTLFVALTCWRFLFVSGLEPLVHRYVIGGSAVVLFLIAFGANAEMGQAAVRRLRFLVVAGLSLSLIAGIPTLLSTPGGGRMIMDTSLRPDLRIGLTLHGVGEYTIYSSVAVALVPMLFVGRGSHRLVAFIFLALGIGAYVSVLLSTFTMAVVIASCSLVAATAIWTVEHKKGGLVLRATVALLLGLIVLGLISQFGDLPQMDFVISKANRLYTGVFGAGFAQGDETGRGEMFIEDVNGFLRSPILGFIPGMSGQIDGGHSSLSNSLVLFGLVQGPMWFLAILLVGYQSWRQTEAGVKRSVTIVSWLALFAGGILNPMWHSPIVMGLLMCLTLPPRKPTSLPPRSVRRAQRQFAR